MFHWMDVGQFLWERQQTMRRTHGLLLSCWPIKIILKYSVTSCSLRQQFNKMKFLHIRNTEISLIENRITSLCIHWYCFPIERDIVVLMMSNLTYDKAVRLIDVAGTEKRLLELLFGITFLFGFRKTLGENLC